MKESSESPQSHKLETLTCSNEKVSSVQRSGLPLPYQERLLAHLNFVTSINHVQSTEVLYQKSASMLSELLGASVASIVLTHQGKNILVTLVADGSVAHLNDWKVCDDSVFKVAMRSRRPITTLDIKLEQFMVGIRAVDTGGCDQFIVCPLSGRQGVYGAISVGWHSHPQLEDADVYFTQLFAQALSTTLDLLNLTSTLSLSQRVLETTQSQIVQQEKVMTLGELIAGLAHEVNTPLGVALTSLSVAQERSVEAETILNAQSVSRRSLLNCIGEISESAALAFTNLSRAAELVKDFKILSSEHRVGYLEDIEVLQLCHDVGESLRPLLKKHRVTLRVRGHEVSLRTDSGILKGALINLIQNACVHGYGPWDPMTQSPNFARVVDILVSDLPKSKDTGVQLCIADFGVGIPSELHERIFEPFYTTARGRGGTGLGLHLVHSTVQGVLGGQLVLESELGEGSRFILSLPTLDMRSVSRRGVDQEEEN